MHRAILVGAFLAIFATSPLLAADDARAQAAMRTLTNRLRSAETQLSTLEAEKAQNEEEKKALTAKLEALTKQAAEADAAKQQLATTEGENTQLKESLQKFETSQAHAVEVATKTEAERAKLAGEVVQLRNKVADRERKNLALYQLANEILRRYERFGLGDALAAKEPFTGLARVKLENYVQDTQDKIADQQVKH